MKTLGAEEIVEKVQRVRNEAWRGMKRWLIWASSLKYVCKGD